MSKKIIPAIQDGSVTLEGVAYKAFQNTFSKLWYIVKGERCNGEKVAQGIEAKTARQAVLQWLTRQGFEWK